MKMISSFWRSQKEKKKEQLMLKPITKLGLKQKGQINIRKSRFMTEVKLMKDTKMQSLLNHNKINRKILMKILNQIKLYRIWTISI